MSRYVSESMNKFFVNYHSTKSHCSDSDSIKRINNQKAKEDSPLTMEGATDQSKSIVQMFQDVANGLPPAMSTAMFQCSIQSVKELAKILSDFFKHGLLSHQVDISLMIARQFNFHKNYPLALVTSISNLAKHNFEMPELLVFVDLIVKICEELGNGRSLITSSIVDILLHWTLPKSNKKVELVQVKVALALVKKVSKFVFEESLQSFQFLYYQIRARLLSASKSDVHDDCNFGHLCFESKSILLDTLIVLCRARKKSTLLDADFILEEDLDIVVEANNNSSVYVMKLNENPFSHPFLAKSASNPEDHPVRKPTVAVCENSPTDKKEDVPSLSKSPTYPSVKLLTPRMIEEETKSAFASYSADQEVKRLQLSPYQDPVDTIFHDQAIDEDILGYLNSPNGGYSFPVQNYSCIGRDPRCSVILDGKEVSRLHARIKQEDDIVKLETLSRTNKVKINGSLINFGTDTLLKDDDIVQIGMETFCWNSRLKEKVSHSLTF